MARRIFARRGHKHAAADLLSDTLIKGDFLVYDGTNLALLGVGTNGQVLTADSAQTEGIKWAATAEADKVYRIGHTYAISGEIKVPSGQTDFIIPFFVSFATGQTAKLVKARHIINDGTSVTCKLQKNGSDVTGFTSISVTTTVGSTDPTDVTLADDDKLALVVTAVSGTPKNMSFTLFLELTN